jgi:hypothetical protein
VAPPTLLLARNPRATEQRDAPSTKPAHDYPTPKRSITPISPEVVATNRLDQAQRSIGPLPIMGRTLPITVKERQKRWVIGGVKAAIGRQLIGKEAQISGKTTPSKR